MHGDKSDVVSLERERDTHNGKYESLNATRVVKPSITHPESCVTRTFDWLQDATLILSRITDPVYR